MSTNLVTPEFDRPIKRRADRLKQKRRLADSLNLEVPICRIFEPAKDKHTWLRSLISHPIWPTITEHQDN
ncbi:hypothetical protein P5673_014783 [Acropora cervicornis]|uniref:Uncharacterized protein n=1 Tax=Acropora cervicornis TaxID=6130 RepID=A0AAD9QIZ7_ACRCE|nr:hypothetical protein P5673_014783 [Acropora cervicornis]